MSTLKQQQQKYQVIFKLAKLWNNKNIELLSTYESCVCDDLRQVESVNRQNRKSSRRVTKDKLIVWK